MFVDFETYREIKSLYSITMDAYSLSLFQWQRRRKIAAYLLLKKRQNKIYRSVGTCEIFKLRKQQGAYHNLVQEMRSKDETKFRNFHRMSKHDFDVLVEKVTPYIYKMYHSREPISPGEMVSVTLRYLAAGISLRSVSYLYRLGLSTVSYIIKATCKAIWEALKLDYLPQPTENQWRKIADDFETKWNFPNCVGAIDGKHVRIQAPPSTGSDYFNYKDFFSIILLAVCDAHYCFTVVDIGAKGRQSDGGVFRNSNFGKQFFSNAISLPPPRKLPDTDEPIPYCLVADAAFPFGINLMRPYPGNFLPQNERVFNYRLSRARRVIENTFGILVAKWRILERPIIAKVETTENMVGALVSLHHFLKISDTQKVDNQKYCPLNYVDRETESGDIIPGEWRNDVTNGLVGAGRMGGNAYTRGASVVRSLLSNYFMHTAPIEPQWAK